MGFAEYRPIHTGGVHAPPMEGDESSRKASVAQGKLQAGGTPQGAPWLADCRMAACHEPAAIAVVPEEWREGQVKETVTVNDVSFHRPLAVGAVIALVAGISLGTSGAAVRADESPLPGVGLSATATDVTSTDTSLASAAHEVVVLVDGDQGPEITKLRTRTVMEAVDLAVELDSQPGVTAEVNQVFSVPTVDADGAGPAKRAGSFDLRSTGSFRSSSVFTLGAEQFGANQWGLAAVNADAAWSVTRGGGTTVAVVDSGVDDTHPDLAGRVLPQVDFVDDPWTGDPTGHGTHVAGIIAASLDGAGVAGLANEVTILPVRVLDADGTGDARTLAAGILEAVDRGATVINVSIGGSRYSELIAEVVEYAVDSGVTVVAAGGNSYMEGDPVEYPAALPGVIAVSSVDRAGQSSWFANSGPHIDIAAPGEEILSTVPGGGWEYFDGTSMAAPFVSASAALVRVANPSLNRSQVEAALLTTARDDADGDGRDYWFGEGILQADRATLAAATAPGGVRAPAARTATVKVKAVSKKSKLRVDVNPNKGRGYWKFQVQKQRADGSWKALKTYKTKGKKETRTVNLKRGTYRVVVEPKYGYGATTSGQVSLRR